MILVICFYYYNKVIVPEESPADVNTDIEGIYNEHCLSLLSLTHNSTYAALTWQCYKADC